MRTVIRLWFLLSAFAVGAQDSALVDTNGVLVHPTNFLSANGIAPLASPALSGNPTAPTETAGDNDTSISTTAFVTAAIEALKALQLWQDTNAVLTTLAALTGGNSSNFFKGTGAFAQVTTNDIPDLVTMLGALQPLDADLTSISGLTWTDANTFLRGDKTLSRDGQNWTNLNASQLLSGTVPMGRLAVGSTNSTTGLAGYWTDGTNRWTSRDGQGLTNIPSANLSGTISIGVLPGLLGSLSTGNGGGALTNLAWPHTTWFTNQNSTNTYTIPSGAKRLLIEMVGHGGGGGSGRRGAAGTIRSGGSGGAGGTYSYRFLNVAELWTNTLVAIVPPTATGGDAVTTDDSNGTNGAAIASTIIYVGSSVSLSNTLLRTQGGGPGIGGDADGSSGGSASSDGVFHGGSGGASSAAGLLGNLGGSTLTGFAGSGGGSGGGITTGDAVSSGAVGGTGPRALGSTTAASGGAPGLDGSSAPASSQIPPLNLALRGFFGAGGGGSQTNAPAGNGADGYGWGSGGGGGGASLNGYLSGRGGNGGPSAIAITVLNCSFPAIAFSDWIGAVAQWTFDTVSFLRHLGIPALDYNKNEVTQ